MSAPRTLDSNFVVLSERRTMSVVTGAYSGPSKNLDFHKKNHSCKLFFGDYYEFNRRDYFF